VMKRGAEAFFPGNFAITEVCIQEWLKGDTSTFGQIEAI
jgi:hypothetical protein